MSRNTLLLTGTCIAMLSITPALAQNAPPAPAAPTSIIGAIQGGKVILDTRLRYEGVDQANLALDASATTLRTRLGWETAAFHGFKALVEFEDVRALGDNYNTTLNGLTQYPVVADPEGTELNRLQLSYSHGPNYAAVIGRQRINMDNQRFVGSIGWRQDEQTMDAASTNFALGNLRINYAYVWGVERVFAQSLDWDSDSHLLTATYKVTDALQLEAMGFLLDFSDTGTAAARAASTETLGLRAFGRLPMAGNTLSYSLTSAQQYDAGLNPGDFDLGYQAAELSLQHGPFTGRLAYELAEGDGARSFSTPLATAHAFNGWADAFDINNPTQLVNGLEDVNVGVTYRVPHAVLGLSNVEVLARYHNFTAERIDADLGEEFDVQITAAINPQTSLNLKYADYEGVTGFASRTKLWLGVEFKL